MPITHFSFNDNQENWHLENISFDKLNLLIGVSGVGKTKIFKALELVCRVATGADYKLNGEDWKIGFKDAEHEYEWTLKSAIDEPKFSPFAHSKLSTIIYEEIVKDKNITLLKRTNSSFLLNDEEIPRFKNTESAINILSKVQTMMPIYKAFKRIIFSDIWQQKHYGSRVNPAENPVKPPAPLDKFQEDSTQLPTIVKAYQLQQRYPDEFYKIKQVFMAIFASVEDIKVSITKKTGGTTYQFEFTFKEKTSHKWISQEEMSAGMFRTLVHLFEISLTLPDSVIVIDELENGLGTNCMPGLTDFLLSQTSHLQVILSSHHPYIINNMPDSSWKLVTRKGGQVSVINAADIPQLQTQSQSQLDKFILLTRLPEYENGIS